MSLFSLTLPLLRLLTRTKNKLKHWFSLPKQARSFISNSESSFCESIDSMKFLKSKALDEVSIGVMSTASTSR